MWSPTHIQVTVQRAKGLLTKGKNETNNCFVTIGLGKEKYQTSVKEKSEPNVSWNEECELKIPDQGNKAELVLTCLHRNNLGIDEFLGQVILPLNEMDVYDRPRSKWFKLQSKPGKEKKNKDRGELEVRINFVVKSGSLTDLSKKEKHKSSIGQLASSVGGSLLSIGTLEKRKGIKKFAKSLGSKMHLHSKKKNKDGDDLSYNGSIASIDAGINNSYNSTPRYGQRAGEADPGVISEDEDEFVFDKLSHKSSGSSLNVRANMRNSENQKFVASNSSSLVNVPDNRWSKGKQSDENQINENEYRENKSSNEIDLENDQLPLPPPSNIISALHEDNDKVKNTSNFNSFNYPKLFNEIKKEPIISNEPNKVSFASNETPYEINLKRQTESTLPEKPETLFANINKENTLKESENIKYDMNTNSNTNSYKSNDPSPKLYVDEWESKLYLDINKSDSLKRNTWQAARVQIPVTPKTDDIERRQSTSSDTDSEEEEEEIIKNKFNDNKSNTVVEEKYEDDEPPVVINLRDVQEYEEQIPRNDNEQIQIKNVSVQNSHDSKRNKLNFDNEDNFQKSPIVNEFMDIKPSNERIKTPLSQKLAMQVPTQRIGKFPEKQNRFVEGEFRRSPNERIIIGHEKSKEEKNSDLAAILEKKYEGKTREELMFIANGMENEVYKYRQRVKELEDYLDNLLLRVMETHPKILQNPYSRTTSAKR